MNNYLSYVLGIAKRASDVITQTNSDKQNGMVEDLKLFSRTSESAPKTIFIKKIWRSFIFYFSQSMLMFVPIICILFLDFARFAIDD